ncbi:hypothetical protein L210DRAFT_3108737 [Boletus edulis BED1]|uniref:Uncharacterized protein n=1 Tax=Boletus edulis BED1 TaxID=1328754 RepID=A0AAD4BZ71_BOLED|nr:hypothetical protein L210DRAFT_3108737 [Boletus edulis BED1]
MEWADPNVVSPSPTHVSTQRSRRPSDLSATVCLEVYGSFDFQPTLGTGERLRKLTTTVEQLLDRSVNDIPFKLFTKDGDVVSPCSSIFVTVKRSKRERSDPSAHRVPGPRCSITKSRGELEDATNQGHGALSYYRKHGGKQHLGRSIAAFERALEICPLNHPCRAAAEANLAMAKFIICQAEEPDVSFAVPLELYRNALIARPTGHVDRPSTLIQLAMVHFVQFEKQRDEVERARAEALLREAMELSASGSHENRAAMFLLQLHASRRMNSVHAGGQSPVESHSTSPLTDEDTWILGFQL